MPRGSANGVDAPLFRLPLIRSPSAAPIPARPVSAVRSTGSSSGRVNSFECTRRRQRACQLVERADAQRVRWRILFRGDRDLARDRGEAEQLDRQRPETLGKIGEVVDAVGVGRVAAVLPRSSRPEWPSPWRQVLAGR